MYEVLCQEQDPELVVSAHERPGARAHIVLTTAQRVPTIYNRPRKRTAYIPGLNPPYTTMRHLYAYTHAKIEPDNELNIAFSGERETLSLTCQKSSIRVEVNNHDLPKPYFKPVRV